jgi:hypothetical protein
LPEHWYYQGCKELVKLNCRLSSESEDGKDTLSDDDVLFDGREGDLLSANDKWSYSDEDEILDHREDDLVCQFPSCVGTYIGITYRTRFKLDVHQQRHEPETLSCNHQLCQETPKLFAARAFAEHQSHHENANRIKPKRKE